MRWILVMGVTGLLTAAVLAQQPSDWATLTPQELLALVQKDASSRQAVVDAASADLADVQRTPLRNLARLTAQLRPIGENFNEAQKQTLCQAVLKRLQQPGLPLADVLGLDYVTLKGSLAQGLGCKDEQLQPVLSYSP